MKLIDSEIDHYWVHFQSGGAEKSKVYPRALVKCYNHDDFVVQLNFYPDNKSIPANSYDKRNKLVYLRYPISMYPNIIDILRNEKPIGPGLAANVRTCKKIWTRRNLQKIAFNSS